ncbi:Veg family protein, partial [Faecalibacillus faecis]|nr:Veg family protein [Faecalibacillus faecis]
MDIQCIRKSIQERIGSKIKISSNKGRHKFVTSQGVITETYPNIFLVEIE